MARKQSIDLRRSLKDLFPDNFLENAARQTGFVQRRRKLNVVAFFWNIVLAFAVGPHRSISSLRRSYERTTGTTWVPSSFYDRFNSKSVAFLKTATERALDQFQLAWGAAEDLATAFRDVILADATVLKLYFGLKKAFPGTRTNSSPAAAELHAVLSVRGKGNSTVAITSERTSELKKLRIGSWVRDRLLLFDLGYFRYRLFSRIRHHGGFFVTRLRPDANPTIVAFHRRVRGNAVELQGPKLKSVFPRLKREVLDAEVEAESQRRVYGGRRRTVRERYRFVAVWDPHSQTYHTFVTNVAPDVLDAEAIAATHRARCQLELLFSELKPGYRMAEISTQRKEVAEALIYAAILTLAASRRLLGLLTRRDRARRMTAGRWWRLLAMYAQDLVLVVVRPPRDVAAFTKNLIKTFLHELVDPDRDRTPLLQDSLQFQRGYARG